MFIENSKTEMPLKSLNSSKLVSETMSLKEMTNISQYYYHYQLARQAYWCNNYNYEVLHTIQTTKNFLAFFAPKTTAQYS
jgi:hypothetical protein